MTNEDHSKRETAGFSNGSEDSEPDPSFDIISPTDDKYDDIETSLVLEKPERNQREEQIVREALGLGGNSDAKWCDARGQSGPSPADFGDHKPIPIDSVCASLVVSDPATTEQLLSEE